MGDRAPFLFSSKEWLECPLATFGTPLPPPSARVEPGTQSFISVKETLCLSSVTLCERLPLQKRKSHPLSGPTGLSSLQLVQLYCFTQCRKMLSPRQATSFCQGHGSLKIRDCAWTVCFLTQEPHSFLQEQLPPASPASYTKAAEWPSSAL